MPFRRPIGSMRPAAFPTLRSNTKAQFRTSFGKRSATASMAAMIALRFVHGTSSLSRPHISNSCRRDDLSAPASGSLVCAWTTAGSEHIFAVRRSRRIGRNRFVRNVLIAIGNSQRSVAVPSADGFGVILDPVVAEAAQWASGQSHHRSRQPNPHEFASAA